MVYVSPQWRVRFETPYLDSSILYRERATEKEKRRREDNIISLMKIVFRNRNRGGNEKREKRAVHFAGVPSSSECIAASSSNWARENDRGRGRAPERRRRRWGRSLKILWIFEILLSFQEFWLLFAYNVLQPLQLSCIKPFLTPIGNPRIPCTFTKWP